MNLPLFSTRKGANLYKDDGLFLKMSIIKIFRCIRMGLEFFKEYIVKWLVLVRGMSKNLRKQ